MKTVFGEIYDKDYITENGEVIDAIFSNKSINDRIVLSPYIIGTTNSLLEVIANKAVEIYFR